MTNSIFDTYFDSYDVPCRTTECSVYRESNFIVKSNNYLLLKVVKDDPQFRKIVSLKPTLGHFRVTSLTMGSLLFAYIVLLLRLVIISVKTEWWLLRMLFFFSIGHIDLYPYEIKTEFCDLEKQRGASLIRYMTRGCPKTEREQGKHWTKTIMTFQTAFSLPLCCILDLAYSHCIFQYPWLFVDRNTWTASTSRTVIVNRWFFFYIIYFTG